MAVPNRSTPLPLYPTSRPPARSPAPCTRPPAHRTRLCRFDGEHKLVYTDKKNAEFSITAANILIATGGRPNYPDIPGAKEFGILDLFLT